MSSTDSLSRNCSDCGVPFVITNGEANFYQSKSMMLPKRCKDCRAKRKAEKLAAAEQKPEF